MNPKITMIIRILLGAAMLFFGLNKFFEFMGPMETTPEMGTIMGGLMAAGYMKIIAVLEITGGVLLLANKFVPAAIIVIGAIMLNAAIFHLLMDPGNALFAIVFFIFSVILAYANKDRFSGVLSA